MQPHITAVRSNMEKIVEASKKKYDNKIRVGFVGYRDLTDHERFIEKDFNTDTAEVLSQMNLLVASGGGDIPEDIHGGLEVGFLLVASPRGQFHELKVKSKIPPGGIPLNLNGLFSTFFG